MRIEITTNEAGGWLSGKRDGIRVGEFHLQSNNRWKWYNSTGAMHFSAEFLRDIADTLDRLNELSASGDA